MTKMVKDKNLEKRLNLRNSLEIGFATSVISGMSLTLALNDYSRGELLMTGMLGTISVFSALPAYLSYRNLRKYINQNR